MLVSEARWSVPSVEVPQLSDVSGRPLRPRFIRPCCSLPRGTVEGGGLFSGIGLRTVLSKTRLLEYLLL